MRGGRSKTRVVDHIEIPITNVYRPQHFGTDHTAICSTLHHTVATLTSAISEQCSRIVRQPVPKPKLSFRVSQADHAFQLKLNVEAA